MLILRQHNFVFAVVCDKLFLSWYIQFSEEHQGYYFYSQDINVQGVYLYQLILKVALSMELANNNSMYVTTLHAEVKRGNPQEEVKSYL